MPLIIPRKIRTLVESYVARDHRDREKGGYFVGRENAIVAFVPVPNFSTGSHANTYSLDAPATKGIAVEFAAMIGGKILADMHTHPNGTIPSEQDGRYVAGLDWPYHVVLADKGKEFDWYAIDRKMVGVQLVESELEFEGIVALAAGEMSLLSLGQLFITPGGELLGTKGDSKTFITVDEDALAVWRWGKDMYNGSRTYSQASRVTKIPVQRVKRAFEKIGWKGYH